ncbi:MAG: aminodeoxychorismate synthase, component I, partial [Woeseiaceae bacterium]|nr:aminodeoxychorismate synthase, component I [Woeseiaceae bacterium]
MLSLHRLSPERYPFLLQSTAANIGIGRYDILFASPGEELILKSLGDSDAGGGFLDKLDQCWRAEMAPSRDDRLPFSGGWFIYLGYELAGEIEPGLDLANDPLLPVAFAVRCRAAIVRDTMTGECSLVYEQGEDFDDANIMADISRIDGMFQRDADAALQDPEIVEDP